MNLTRYALGMAICGSMVACGGSKPAVETTPAPQSAPAVAVVDSSANATPVNSAEVSSVQSAPAEQKFSLEDPMARYSYALGMDLGKAVANVNVPLNMDVLMGAIKDQIDSSRTVQMNDTACEKALQELLLKMQLQKEADAKVAAQKALEEQAQFLAKNIMDSTVKVTTKGVQYKVITEGAGLTPKAADKVKVHYVGTLLDGTEFDNSVKRGEPLEFPVSAVIEGWQDLLQVMKEGEKVKAWIPSALAYGEEGVDPLIPANAMLVFEVELLKVLAEVPAAEDLAAPAADSAK
ncbi:MAG: FKBP-type peptidyl-prolyl cis-trans isomerase [Fibrobacter sp.]|nr:FKBP-type peptidyl-prolyl cis-trans isomerase [Fibrobacter sp.]